jgi:hypothetical protein
MLQPRTYPTLLGQTLVLEPAPFIALAEDDEPVAEGLFLTAIVGLLVGVAQFVGGLLFSWVMPSAAAVQTVLAQAAPALDHLGLGALGSRAARLWDWGTLFYGYETGWLRIFNLVWEPFTLLVQWLVVGIVVFAVARALGGTGTLKQTLGATALVAAPSLLLFVNVLPFTTVSALLLQVWGLLIVYRAVEVAHELDWRRAAFAAVVGVVALWAVAFAAATLAGLIFFAL